jgi:hypothetical protein
MKTLTEQKIVIAAIKLGCKILRQRQTKKTKKKQQTHSIIRRVVK